MKLHIQVDETNDQVYLGFRAPATKSVARTVEIGEGVYADLDKNGRLIGLDVGSASRIFGQLGDISIETLVGVKEAAALLGVQKSNFVRDYASRKDFPKPIADLASGRIWLKSQLEGYRGRRSTRRRQSLPA